MPELCRVVAWGFYNPPNLGTEHVRDCDGSCAAQARYDELTEASDG